MITDNEYYLVTTNNWFFAPDGKQYKAAWGKGKVFGTKEVFGANPTRSTNWFARIGEGDKSILVSGCQINYAMRCDKRPVILEGSFENTATPGNSQDRNSIWLTE